MLGGWLAERRRDHRSPMTVVCDALSSFWPLFLLFFFGPGYNIHAEQGACKSQRAVRVEEGRRLSPHFVPHLCPGSAVQTFTELVCSSFYCSAKKEKSTEHRPWCFGCQGPGLPGRVAPLGVRFVRRKSWKRRWSEVAREAGLINRRAGAEICFT